MLQDIVKICQELLDCPQAGSAKEYAESRISKNMMDYFKIGYFPKSNELYLITDYLKEKNLINSGLFYYRFSEEEGNFVLHSTLEQHNLIMPYKDSYGKTIAIVGRSILSEKEREYKKISKYKNTKFFKSDHLFNLYRAKEAIVKNNCVFVVEGQFDCITAINYGIDNCVCIGSSNMSFAQFAILSRYTNRIILLLDNDDAGRNGMDRAVKKFGVKEGKIPDGYKDLDQFLMEEGKDAKEHIEQMIT